MKELVKRFPVFLEKSIPENPLKCEYFLPFVVDELLGEKKATVKVLKSMDKWYGVTYKEDKPVVVAATQNLKRWRAVSTEIMGGIIEWKLTGK